jgi:murein DD-endopeptidase MepM/ murein hydrolase activator NlpD
VAFVLFLLAGVNVYIFAFRRGTSLRELMRTSELAKQGSAATISTGGAAPPPAPPPVRPRAPVEEDDGRFVDGVLRENDLLDRVLRAEGLSVRDTLEVGAALAKLFDPTSARPGHAYTLHFDGEERVRSVDLRVSPGLAFHVERDASGLWRATRDERPVTTRVAEVGGVVGGSLYDSVKRAGESPALASAIADLLAGDLSFYADAQPGDRYKLLVEKLYTGGRFSRYGHILALEYAGRTSLRAFWFQPQDGSQPGYYSEHGESLARSLVKAPLKYVRAAAALDRRHLQPTAQRPGVDHPAPPGTPVWSTAAGRVSYVGPRPGVGNVVAIAHPGGLETVYQLLGKLARGLRPGQEVRQKQVIGYVAARPGPDASGITLARVRYLAKLNGAFVDPLKLKPTRGEPVAARHRLEFADAIAPRLTTLAAVETRPADRLGY